MGKTNIHHRSGFMRSLAALLCAVCVFGLVPTQAFALSPGQKASSWPGDNYVGSDGQYYYAPAPYTYLVYHSDGTMDVKSSSGGSAYRHYMPTASDGSSQAGLLCGERGALPHFRKYLHIGKRDQQSNYLNLLPAEARRGITLTAIYGRKPGARLPVPGINEDDYKIATQVILWEYQKQPKKRPVQPAWERPCGRQPVFQYHCRTPGRESLQLDSFTGCLPLNGSLLHLHQKKRGAGAGTEMGYGKENLYPDGHRHQ